MVVVVLSNAGDHVPVIDSLDVVGKAAKESPLHIGATGLKVGVTGVSIVKNKVGITAILKFLIEMYLFGVVVVVLRTKLVKGVVVKRPKNSVSAVTVLLSTDESE